MYVGRVHFPFSGLSILLFRSDGGAARFAETVGRSDFCGPHHPKATLPLLTRKPPGFDLGVGYFALPAASHPTSFCTVVLESGERLPAWWIDSLGSRSTSVRVGPSVTGAIASRLLPWEAIVGIRSPHEPPAYTHPDRPGVLLHNCSLLCHHCWQLGQCRIVPS